MKPGSQQKCLYFCFAQGIGAVAREYMDAIVELLAAGTVVEGFQAIVIQVLCPGMTQTAGGARSHPGRPPRRVFEAD